MTNSTASASRSARAAALEVAIANQRLAVRRAELDYDDALSLPSWFTSEVASAGRAFESALSSLWRLERQLAAL